MKEESITNGVVPVNVGDVIYATLRNWKMIVVSVFVCLGLGVGYILVSVPKYERRAEIIVKSRGSGASLGQGIGSSVAASLGLGMLAGNSGMEDEIVKIVSPDALREVILRLGLDVNCSKNGLLPHASQYGKEKILNVSMPGVKENQSVEFDVKVDAEGNVSIRNLEVSKKDSLYDEVKSFRQKDAVTLGSPISTPVGDIIIDKGPAYKSGKKYDMAVEHPKMANVIFGCDKMLTVNLWSKFGQTIELSYIATDEQLAEDFLSTLVEVYNENETAERNRVIDVTNEFVDSRLAEVARDLGVAEGDYFGYMSRNLITDAGKAAEIYLEQNRDVEAGLTQLSNMRFVAEQLRVFIEDEKNRYSPLPLLAGSEAKGVNQSIEAYNQLMATRNRLSEVSSAAHPKVAAFDSQLSAARTQILKSVDDEINSLQKQESSLLNVRGKATGLMKNAPHQSKEMTNLGREKEFKEAVYLFLLQSREENALRQLQNSLTPQVVLKPYGISKPVSPRKILVVALSLIMGLALPFFYNLLKECLNLNQRDRVALARKSIPVAADIPLNTKDVNKTNEAFRLLCAGLGLPKDSGGVIAVTSYKKGDGKSYVVSHLSDAMKQAGYAVVCADFADMSQLWTEPGKIVIVECRPISDSADTVVAGKIADITLVVADEGSMGGSLASRIAALKTDNDIKDVRVVLNRCR